MMMMMVVVVVVMMTWLCVIASCAQQLQSTGSVWEFCDKFTTLPRGQFSIAQLICFIALLLVLSSMMMMMMMMMMIRCLTRWDIHFLD